MQTMQQFCLRWNNHQPNFISVFTSLLSDKTLVDVTLACEGKHLQAHRVVLSACSAYFQTLFTVNPCQHPIVILKDIRFSDLKTMVDFMYYGEVNVSQEQLPAILKIADMLKIKGLADIPSVSDPMGGQIADKDIYGSPSPSSPAIRRKRLRKSSTGSGSASTEQTSEDVMSEGVQIHSPSVKIEHVDEVPRTLSRQSLRNSHQDPSTDSEPKEGSQEIGPEDFKRQSSNESRQISYEARQMSSDSRQGSYEIRQLSHESRQSSTEGRQVSCESRQGSRDGKQPSPEAGKHQLLSHENRQASHESRLSHESSLDSGPTDPEGSNSNLSPSQGQMKVGPKRGRLLMRQQRIKKESDVRMSPDSEPGSPSFPSSNLLSVPPVKIERQRSDPTPTLQTHSPPPSQSSLNLLTVPQPTFSVRQHSFPSQSLSTPAFASNTFFVQRQLSQPPNAKTEDVSRSSSPSIVMESLPIVRIISESEPGGNRSNSLVHRLRSEEAKKRINEIDTSRPVHCPVQRSGPALGCNFCWNTTDAHGRILRRKTKFHCPECKTNLCIVPCFQQYHHKQEELTTNKHSEHSSSAS